ncbi:SDR family NAD(P)-dependent oxidoreductase [Desulfopila aestuarii]|uniref:3-oxoacyl-[acyl-carrier protein] reductase n=1 Tax=Desulfopila aestuarii DSM 18488 TaxID=1121416 RepID=A0A1M7YDC9_9BACT|nr:SDR family oxidoreductase [Desulfopila aestuarii]SHO50635.1 3-oxoacyl-[acyl-carrier protein] reductase [Desulfopila aestuarii DSM 18488]
MSSPELSPRPAALIPGASRIIGRHIARRFAACGVNLILPWFDWPESVEEMEKEFQDANVEVLSCQCDLRDFSAVSELLEIAKKRFGRLDYLINNIERGGMPVVHGSYLHEHNRDQWELEFDTTVKAKWNLFTCSLPLMQQTHGAVVNISSIAGLCGRSGPAASFFNDGYSAANRSVSSLTETWARQGAPTVRVNELMLGLISGRHGDNTRGWTALSGKEKDALIEHTLLGRLGKPEEVAEAVYFLACQASFMTGTVIRMDGGYLLGGDRVPPLPEGIL